MRQFEEPTLVIFLAQVAAILAYIPFSYIAYRSVRVPLKRERMKQSLLQLGIRQEKELGAIIVSEYSLKDYAWPLLFAVGVTFFTFAGTHSYTIQTGLAKGMSEVVINVFGVDSLLERALLTARVQYWGFLGALIYSFHLTFRRFLAYDLTPSVYIFIANRFALAFVVGTAVGFGLGTFSTAAGVPLDVNLATAGIVVFFIGFFPEQGINWITAMAQKALKQQEGMSKEINLSEIEGLSIWHQGRLKQEGIDNVQNLATADVPALVVSAPFTVNQIIDWIDQAILLIHTSRLQFEQLERAGVIRASDLLSNTGDGRSLNELADATGLKKSELKVLSQTLQSALNIKPVTRFRWQSSLDEEKVTKAAAIQPFQTSSSPAMTLPREQEAVMLETEA